MSYKCAILGHKYANAEVDREREEDGNEVVITVRETETCTRCGETRVVSENKEVTTLETAADIVADDLAEDPGSPTEEPSGEGGETAPEPPTGSPEPTTDHPAATEIPEAEPDVADDVATEEDDAVILDDGSEDEDDEDEEVDAGREPGEWPEESAGEGSQDGEVDWPDHHRNDGDEPDWELPSDIDPHPETEGPVRRAGGDALTVPEGEFHCPECGFTTPVESSSLRAGDFCPECHKGALEHRTD